MDAKERKVGEILTENFCYRIPAYQRPYSWSDEHAAQLFFDIKSSWKADEEEYFIGSLITIKTSDGKNNDIYEVVDGQQRLTTLTILLARMHDRIVDAEVKVHISMRLRPFKALRKGLPPRLTLRNEDQSFFNSHILDGMRYTKDPTTLNAPQRHLIENALKFDELLADLSEEELISLADFIDEKVSVVFVFTESFDSAYRLFSVLNARGLSLSSADLIKGEFFKRGQEDKVTESRIEDLWREIEKQVGIDGLDAFLSHHRTSVLANKMSRNLHEEFKPLIRDSKPVKLLESLIVSVSNYESIAPLSFKSPKTHQRMQSLERMKHSDWIPPLLAFLNNPVSDLSVDTFIDLLERITMQNWVLRTPPSARLTVYHQLINAINSGKKSNEIRDIYNKNAKDNLFIRDLGENLYGEQYAKSVLLYLESSTQDHMVSKTFSDSGISIEHVLPQNIEHDYWNNLFTPEQHRQWLNKIGNLTLISGRMNSSAKNYAFDRKREVFIGKAQKASFDMTKDICSHEDWTCDVIERRHRDLLTKAQQLWCISHIQVQTMAV
jgi:Protein of unknown function DUF262/Protein of unknown function (DUF1524)